MGHYQGIYLGPFVEHVIKEEQFTIELAQEISEVLDWNGGVSLPPTIDVRGVVYHRYCFMPYTIRPDGPSRSLRIDIYDYQIVDYHGLNIPEEIDWYIRSYRDELGRLATSFDQEGSYRWGIIKWVW